MARPTVNNHTVLLVSPGGIDDQGGMGRAMRYMVQSWVGRPDAPAFIVLDPRGTGHVAWSPFFLAATLLRILWLSATRTVDVIHVNIAERGSVVRKGIVVALARLIGKPVLLHAHGAELIGFYERLPAAAQRAVAWVFKSAQCNVVLGEPWRRFLIDQLGVPVERVRVLYNAVPEPRVPRQPNGVGGCRLLFLGRLGERKGARELLEALASPALRRLDWSLTLAGDGEVECFRELAASLDLAARVRIPGWLSQQEAAAAMADADVFVLPSRDEGLPMAILEALAAGVAVVTTPVGAIPEVLEDGRTALLVPPADAPALAAALGRVIRDEALRARLAENGRRLFERRFTIDAYLGKVGGLYCDCTAAA